MCTVNVADINSNLKDTTHHDQPIVHADRSFITDRFNMF